MFARCKGRSCSYKAKERVEEEGEPEAQRQLLPEATSSWSAHSSRAARFLFKSTDMIGGRLEASVLLSSTVYK